MRKAAVIREEVKIGAITPQQANVELLLDIRELMEQVAVNTRKPGRPRKKRGEEPTGNKPSSPPVD